MSRDFIVAQTLDLISTNGCTATFVGKTDAYKNLWKNGASGCNVCRSHTVVRSGRTFFVSKRTNLFHRLAN